MSHEIACANSGILAAVKAMAQLLRLLRDVASQPDSCPSNPMDHTLDIDTLYQAGLGSAIRCLVCQGYVNHFNENQNLQGGAASRKHNCRFDSQSRFLVTPEGKAFARQLHNALAAELNVGVRSPLCANPRHLSISRPDGPNFDIKRRELRIGATSISSFRKSAHNQIAILSAFELEGWPPRIDDPLPWDPNIDHAQRLHITVYRLNCHQHPPTLRFLSDGTGNGICWEYHPAHQKRSISFAKKV